jgi:hypothetical protein
MSDIKLFHIAKNKVTELEGKSVAVEKPIQALIEIHFIDIHWAKFDEKTNSTN